MDDRKKYRERERDSQENEERKWESEMRKLSCKNKFLPSFENNSSGEWVNIQFLLFPLFLFEITFATCLIASI